MLKTYDPNIRWSKHTVEITYQMWEHVYTTEVEIGGNCIGWDVMKSAIESHASKLFDEQGDYPTLVLTAPDGEELETSCSEDGEDDDIEDWLGRMCVGVKIIKHEKEHTKS